MWTNQNAAEINRPPFFAAEYELTTESKPTPTTEPQISDKAMLGPYSPTLILHGGSGAIIRDHLPPALYQQYRSSLLQYLGSTHIKLQSGTSALDAACHAVSL